MGSAEGSIPFLEGAGSRLSCIGLPDKPTPLETVVNKCI